MTGFSGHRDMGWCQGAIIGRLDTSSNSTAGQQSSLVGGSKMPRITDHRAMLSRVQYDPVQPVGADLAVWGLEVERDLRARLSGN